MRMNVPTLPLVVETTRWPLMKISGVRFMTVLHYVSSCWDSSVPAFTGRRACHTGTLVHAFSTGALVMRFDGARVTCIDAARSRQPIHLLLSVLSCVACGAEHMAENKQLPGGLIFSSAIGRATIRSVSVCALLRGSCREPCHHRVLQPYGSRVDRSLGPLT